MIGPIRFVYSVIWLAIAFSILGSLKEATMVMAGMAADSQRTELSYGKWNRKLLESARYQTRK